MILYVQQGLMPSYLQIHLNNCMAKNKLTDQQQRRIDSNQQARVDNTSGSIRGLVIGQAGHKLDVETTNGVLQCARRKNTGAIVTGDEVLLEAVPPAEHVITAVVPRSSLLARPDFRGQMKAIAANLDRIFIICAIKPELNEGLIDRYLVAAETLNITPVIVLNKIDLAEENQLTDLRRRVSIYAELGYEIIESSAKNQHGIDTLLKSLHTHTSILVGQSGVGKSSLVNALLPGVNIKTREISESSNKGTHTTSASRLYHLPNGGNLIDSPGVREFGLWQVSAEELFNGFSEFRQYQGLCKFSNCQHKTEPHCAILDAIEAGKINQSRYDSYNRILESLTE